VTTRPDPPDLATIDEVIALARDRTDPGAYAWAAAGAGQGVTLARNAISLNQLALVPRVLRDVEHVDAGSSLLGVPLAFPVILAPVGALALYDRDDGVAAGRAATDMSTSAMVSALTTSPWEEVAATSLGRHFFQLYVFGDRDWTSEVLTRVGHAGFAGVCVTVDTPVIARRDRSLEARFTWSTPPGGAPNLRSHGSDPGYRTRHSWSDLQWLISATDLPVIVKGIMTIDDARAAVEAGARAVYVSNHGGRVVDHSLSTIEVLAEIVDAVGSEVQVVVDSGFTRGAEVCKALALGARAVGIGRLQCWGLAAGGRAGLVRVLELMREEIIITMANIGCRSVDEITRDRVRWSNAAPPDGPSDL